MKLNELDLEYQKKILNWIPKRIFDIHNHIGLSSHHKPLSDERKVSCMAASEAYNQSRYILEKKFKSLLPGIKVDYVVFPFPFRETHIKKANNYALSCTNPFILGDLEKPKETLDLLKKSSVRGLKIYYDSLKRDYSKIRILDFLPEIFLDELNKSQKPIMLHVPGSSVNDNENVNELNYVLNKFPKVKIILAHMGRCSTKEELIGASIKLKNLENIFWETSTISSSEVFEEAIKIFGIEKILYGSDSPYAFTKGRIMDVPGEIKNPFITEKRFPWTKPYLRGWYLKNKPPLTFLLYHQLDAMRNAFENLEINTEDLEKVFYGNAINLLKN